MATSNASKKREQHAAAKSENTADAIPTIIALPPPPPLPAAPNTSKQYNGKNESTNGGKFSKKKIDTRSASNNSNKPLGLENLGNTCFMNSALQCLSRTKLLIPKLELFGNGKDISVLVTQTEGKAKIFVQNPLEQKLQNEDSSELGKEKLAATEQSVANFQAPFYVNLEISPESMTARLKHAFKAITRQADPDTDTNYNSREFNSRNGGHFNGFRPHRIHNMISSKNFRPGSQHDSHELLRTIVDMLKKDQTRAFRLAIMKKFGVAKGGEGSDPKMVELVKSLDQKVKHQTFVDEIFGGELMTIQTCLSCQSIKRSHEEFLDLSLPIRVSKPKQNDNSTESCAKPTSIFQSEDKNDNEIVINRSMEECLRSFTQPEMLTGSNCVECENCHRINLKKVEDGAAFEDIFPCTKNSSPSTNNSDEAGTSSQKSGKQKRQEEKKKRRPSRQARLKNQISRQEQTSKENTELVPSDPEQEQDQALPGSSLSIVENHFTSKEPSEASKSTLDDYVVVSDSDIKSSAQVAKRKQIDFDDADDFEDDIALLDINFVPGTDQDQGVELNQDVDAELASPKGDADFNLDVDADGDGGDSDFPSAADGIGGSASEDEGGQGVPPIDLDLPAYDKFNSFNGVPRVSPMFAAASSLKTTELTEKTAADEGYSEGSAENVGAGAGEIIVKPTVNQSQSLSQGSSSRNSISDPDESSKGSGSELKNGVTKKGPPVTKCPCSRQQAISRPPEFLTIHLKRFQISIRGFTSKLSEHVEFPLLLDLTQFCRAASVESETEIFDEEGQVKYVLYGIVEHSGSLHWGHYVAYIKVPGDAKHPADSWYYVSDSTVNCVPEENIPYRDPYILFYERVRGDTKKSIEQALDNKQHTNAKGGCFSNKSGKTNGWTSDRPGPTISPVQTWVGAWGDEEPVQEYGPMTKPDGEDDNHEGNIEVEVNVETTAGDSEEVAAGGDIGDWGSHEQQLDPKASWNTTAIEEPQSDNANLWGDDSPSPGPSCAIVDHADKSFAWTSPIPISNGSFPVRPWADGDSQSEESSSPQSSRNPQELEAGVEQQQQSKLQLVPEAAVTSTINFIDDSSEEF